MTCPALLFDMTVRPVGSYTLNYTVSDGVHTVWATRTVVVLRTSMCCLLPLGCRSHA